MKAAIANNATATVVLRMLILKHARNWSFKTLEQEVRVNLVYREFTRIGTEKVPDAKVIAKIARVLGPSVMEELHRRIVELARENKLVSQDERCVSTPQWWRRISIIVCPVKAGVFSGSQPRQGKSQRPCSLDSQEEGN